MSIPRLILGLTAFLCVCVSGADLGPGDRLPDCSKVPVLTVQQAYRTDLHYVPSLEQLLIPDGVTVVHFCSPRAPRGGAFRSFLLQELSSLKKGMHNMPYPCRVVPVIPLGEKGRLDCLALLKEAGEEEEVWVQEPVYYEPTYPMPGLYRTFRPGTSGLGGNEITTSWTYLISPRREIIAVRAPGEDGNLYEWLQKNMPAQVTPVPQAPSTAMEMPEASPWRWPAFRRSSDRAAAAAVIPDTLPFTYLAWQQYVGGTFASPAVQDGRVYVNTDNNGLCVLSLDRGERLGTLYTSDFAWWSSPVVAGDMVFTCSGDGTVTAAHRITLVEKWTAELGSLVTSSPVVSGGALFVGARDGAVYALDAANGDQLWRFQTGGEISSSPALADGALLIGSGDRSLYCLDAKTGEFRWSAATGAPVDSSPTVADGTVYVGSFDGGLYAFALADGKLVWRCELGGWVHSSPAVDEATVFVGSVNVRRDQAPVFAWIDRATGALKGRFVMPQPVYSSPTLWGDTALIGCRDGRLYAFDRKMAQTQPLWTWATRGYLHASPVVVGDTVLLASFDGNVYALRQSKPISVWTDKDVVPRWFMAALARQLYQESAELIVRAGKGEPGAELVLTQFDDLLKQIRAQVANPGTAPRVLPRDVPAEHPGAPFVEYVLTAGLLGGYPDGTFRPSEPTNRYQFASALASVLDWVTRPDYTWRTLKTENMAGVQVEVRTDPVEGRPPIQPADVPSSHWANNAITQQAQKGLLQVDAEGYFRGERQVTLADAREQWNLIAASVKVVRTE